MAKSFHELSSRTQIAIFALLSLTTIGAAWQVLIGPERTELATRRARLSALQSDVARAAATAKRLPQLEQEIATLERSLVATTAVLPDEKDAQDVLRQLHALASESELSLTSFTPKAVTEKSQYSEWPIELGLDGGYHDLGRFFDRIASLPLLVSVSNLHLKAHAQPGGTGSLTASCTATTFVFRRDGPPASVPAAGAKQ
ncbi:MAG: type 4a pilus biogenesis protein PilO [Acidobacteria bacterium]|nr:type 4a pilus biogenesis protein PilO [Acidobacteriota bacterium]